MANSGKKGMASGPRGRGAASPWRLGISVSRDILRQELHSDRRGAFGGESWPDSAASLPASGKPAKGTHLAGHISRIRVRYADTDQGGVVYNANYLVFFEVGRTEMMRELGCPYADLEAEGIIMPVVEAHLRYASPARYDDLLEIETAISEVKRVRFRIDTSIRHAETGRLVCEGWVWLAATRRDGGPCRLPERFLEVLVK